MRTSRHRLLQLLRIVTILAPFQAFVIHSPSHTKSLQKDLHQTLTTTTLFLSDEAYRWSSSSAMDRRERIVEQSTTSRSGALTEAQRQALQRQIPKYTIAVPEEISGEQQQQYCRYILWRNLLLHTPELAGYPVSFVVDQALLLDINENLPPSCQTTLPYLDQVEIRDGGIAGNVYGLVGVADGTEISTPPLVHLPPRQQYYIQVDNGGVVYELGEWKKHDDVTAAGIEATTTKSRLTTTTPPSSTTWLDRDVVHLAGLSAITLAAGWAMETLSHHLTVNIFWV